MITAHINNMIGRIPFRIFLPVVLTVLLFIMTIFLLILPAMEERMMEGKREVIRELVASVWSSLEGYARQEREGVMTRDQAQALAIEHIRGLRYGPDFKDYFWLNDMQPRMIMHPYRPDLEGKDISGGQASFFSLCGNRENQWCRLCGLSVAMDGRPFPHRSQNFICHGF